ncbi:hypothetical protein AB0C52_10975 [Streptomyces sp. NPDC048717]|uniref:hypothetical protein n=1 Tax=Streptomyces sp. NPDC048717 TaxID=3154928 RepID=UPI003423CA6A
MPTLTVQSGPTQVPTCAMSFTQPHTGTGLHAGDDIVLNIYLIQPKECGKVLGH